MKYPVSYHRINITLPDRELRLVDRMAPKGERSRFIAEAIRHYATASRRAELKKRLRAGAVRRAERDRRLAEDWLDVDDEVVPRRPA
jgi:CopG family transcriptional regulator/antitoxin EndoAI